MSIVRLLIYLTVIVMLSQAGLGSTSDAAKGIVSDALNPGHLLELNDSSLKVALKDHPYLFLYCHDEWCKSCRSMKPVISSLAGDLGGQVSFGVIDVLKSAETDSRYNITSAPTILAFRDGTLIGTEVEPTSKLDVFGWIYELDPNINTSLIDYDDLIGNSISQGSPIPLTQIGVDNPGLPVQVTDRSLDSALDEYPLFILEGFADWCGYCKRMNLTFLQLSKELKGRAAFGLINAEENNVTAEKYNITSFPTILIFDNGALIKRDVGYKAKSNFLKSLNSSGITFS
jgi:thioredoxin 1